MARIHVENIPPLLAIHNVERLTDLVQGNMTHFIDGKGDYLIWWSVGSYLGELSGAVFPMLERYTEPLEVLPRPEMAY